MEEHQHNDNVYMVDGAGKDGLLVCKDCAPEELQGGNECFCKCHALGRQQCPQCRKFHKTVFLG